MNNKLIKNTILYGVGDFVVTATTAFLLIPIYLHYISPKEYGVFNILNNNIALLTYIFQFGLVSAFSRIYFIRKKDEKHFSYLGSIITFHFIYSFLIGILLYFFGAFLFNWISPSINKKEFLLYSVLMAFLSFVPSMYYAWLRVEEKVMNFVVYQITTTGLLLLGISINIFFLKLNLESILLTFISTYGVIWLFVILKLKSKIKLRFNKFDVFESLKFALPIFCSYITYFLMSRYSLIILQNHVSLEKIGYFSLSLQIAMVPTFVSVAFGKALQPYIFSADNDEDLKLRASNVDKIYKIGMLWLVAVLIIVSDTVLPFVFPSGYKFVIKNMHFLFIVNLLYNFTLVENSILLYKLRTKALLVITISGALLNVILNHMLVVSYSTNGVIISMGISYLSTLCLESYFSRRLVNFKYDTSKIIISLLLILAVLILKYFFTLQTEFYLAFKIIVIIVLSLFLLRTIKEFKNQEYDKKA